jgi:hypothetical protein
MDAKRRAEYQECRDEIAKWMQEYNDAMDKAMPTAGAPPSYKAPASTNATYQRLLGMIEEDGIWSSAFAALPKGDLTITDAFSVIEALDGLLAVRTN